MVYKIQAVPIQSTTTLPHSEMVQPIHHHHIINNNNANNPHTKDVYIRDTNGRWSCKHCCAVPLHFRLPGAVYGDIYSSYPSALFIEHHLEVCMGNQYQYCPPILATYLPVYPSPSQSNVLSMSSRNSFSTTHNNVPSVITTTTRASSSGSTSSTVETRMVYKPCVPATNTNNASLIEDQDKALLTDYFQFLMRQYRMTKFEETDRLCKNNGKRDNMPLHYGGLECRHCCSDVNHNLCDDKRNKSGRKFFWASVDRLSNSLSEFPTHLLRCRSTPKDVKETLMLLKKEHAKQMGRIPRGSQKVYLRRLWRKIHQEKQEQKQQSNEGLAPRNEEEDDAVSIASSITTDPEIRTFTNALNTLNRSRGPPHILQVSNRDNLGVFRDDSNTNETPRIGIRYVHCTGNGQQKEKKQYTIAALQLRNHPSRKCIVALPGSVMYCNTLSPPDKSRVSSSNSGGSMVDPLDLFADIAAMQKPIR